MFFDGNVIRASHLKPGRDLLFDRVSRIEFADARAGLMRNHVARFGRVKIGIVESSGHVIGLSAPEEASFLSPLSGRFRTAVKGASLEAASEGGVFIRPGDRETTVGRDQRGAYRAMIALAPLPRVRGGAPGHAVAKVASAPAYRSMAGILRHVIEEVARGASPLGRMTSRLAVESLILDGFAALELFDAPSASTERAGASRVRAAQEFIRAHAAEPLTVAEIARAVGVGSRALQAGFRDQLGTSPRAFLTEVRLDLAREMLLAPQQGATVADIVHECGFVHGGRFAAAYRARFGESPSATLARAVGPEAGSAPRR